MERQCLWPDCEAAPVVVLKTPGEPNEYLCAQHATDAEELLAAVASMTGNGNGDRAT